MCTMIQNVFFDVSILLALTITIAFVVRLLHQPMIVSYLIAGIFAGPVFFNLLHGSHEIFEALAQFGVLLLLFMLGLSLNMEHIKKIGKIATIAGITQVTFTAAIGFLILRALGIDQTASAYLAVAITFSSTIVIVKLLSDKKDLETVYGRYVVGVMIIQDIVAILALLLLSVFGGDQALGTALGLFVAKACVLLVGITFLARIILPRLINYIASSAEFLFLFTITWCFLVATGLSALGFSPEIGAIAAGLTLGSSPYQPQIISRIKPLRDFFLVIFFLMLGGNLSFDSIGGAIIPGLFISLFVLFGNPFIFYHTFRRLRFTRRNSFLAGITAAQVSEFGFILLVAGVSYGHITGSTELPIFTIVALITIICSSYAITYGDALYRLLSPLFKLFGPDKYVQAQQKPESYHTLVVGYHRMGKRIVTALQKKKETFAVLDYNPENIHALSGKGIPHFFGDIADIEFLDIVPFSEAKLIISTVPTADDSITLLKHIKANNKRAIIIVTVSSEKDIPLLYSHGASYVIMPHLLGSHFISDVLHKKEWTKTTFETLKKEQKKDLEKHN
jgi:Kef-type K+ transport system membrane component KefB